MKSRYDKKFERLAAELRVSSYAATKKYDRDVELFSLVDSSTHAVEAALAALDSNIGPVQTDEERHVVFEAKKLKYESADKALMSLIYQREFLFDPELRVQLDDFRKLGWEVGFAISQKYSYPNSYDVAAHERLTAMKKRLRQLKSGISEGLKERLDRFENLTPPSPGPDTPSRAE